jgi:hypothetical protein
MLAYKMLLSKQIFFKYEHFIIFNIVHTSLKILKMVPKIKNTNSQSYILSTYVQW